LTCKKAAEIAANLIRRHLTIAQRTLIVREILLPEAEAEAKTRLEEGRRRGGAEHALAPTGAQANRAPKASQIAAGGTRPPGKTAAEIAGRSGHHAPGQRTQGGT